MNSLRYAADRQRARRLLGGDERAYDDFFNEYFPRVYRFCARRLPENELEDVSMNVMRQVFRRLETYRGEASLFTWVCQVARSEISAYYRKHQNQPVMVPVEEDPAIRAELESLTAAVSAEPDTALMADQRQQLIGVLLDHLPARYADVLEAKYVEGLSMAEIAARMEVTPKAVESLLSRARVAFREAFASIDRELGATVLAFSRESR